MARTSRQLAALGVTIALALSSGSNASLSNGLGQDELGLELDGKKLFDKETFGGNGRTCLTCHSKDTGTLTLADVQRIIDKADPDDTFLIHDALDEDGVGTTRVQAHATIRMTIPLPPWLSLADDPGATHVTVFRGIPSTRNTPALDPVLLHDGRAPTLQEQARGAIHDHYQNTVEPTTAQLDAIAEFQRTDARFFSSPALRKFAATGAPPELPLGITPAERRGRTFLVDAPFNPPSKRGICALCHGGPMLNMVNQAHSSVFRRQPAGGSPLHQHGCDDRQRTQQSDPDVGRQRRDQPGGDDRFARCRAAPRPHSSAAQPPPSVIPRAFFAELFKIPTLWGVKDTAPYFHDNGAKTLRDAVAHYQRFFNFTEAQDPVGSRSLGGLITLTDDDVDDIVAYLKLLGPNRIDK